MDRRKFLGGLGAAVVATVLPKPVRAEEYFEKLKAETEANNLDVAMADKVDGEWTNASYTTASTSLFMNGYGEFGPLNGRKK